MVTSSAVVGSSASISLGAPAMRHGDHGALQHAAGPLMGILVEPLLRAGDADAAAAGRCRGPRACCRPHAADARRRPSVIWSPIGQTGLRLVIGFWKIIAMLGAAQPAHLGIVEAQRSRPSNSSAPAEMRIGRGRQQPQDAAAQHRLAAAGFADDAQGARRGRIDEMRCRHWRGCGPARPRNSVVRSAIRSRRLGGRRRVGGREGRRSVIHQPRWCSPSRWARPSPIRLSAVPVSTTANAGRVADPPGLEDEVLALGDHRAPFRLRRRDAEAEEAESPTPAGC